MLCNSSRVLFAIVFALRLLSAAQKVACDANPALDAFFLELDNNHDGAIDVYEASKFIGVSIGGQEFDEPQEAEDAATSFLHAMDGGDAGSTVSVDELDVHLHSVLSGVRVWEWIRYGVGLPQYAEAFRVHSITPLDFPVLVQDNGKILEEELGVSSPFHRAKLVRAIRLQILGLGMPPSELQAVTCSPVTSADGGRLGGRASLHWSPPAHPGVPPLHRYVLERAAADGMWRLETELDDPQPAAVGVSWVGPGTAAAVAAGGMEGREGHPAWTGAGHRGSGTAGGRVLFRVSAWNLYGKSPYGFAACQFDPVLPPPGFPLLAAVVAEEAANGTSGIGEGGAAAAAVVVERSVARSRGASGPATSGGAGGGRFWGWGPLSPAQFPSAEEEAAVCPSCQGGLEPTERVPSYSSAEGEAELMRILMQSQAGRTDSAPMSGIHRTLVPSANDRAVVKRSSGPLETTPQSVSSHHSPAGRISSPPSSPPPPRSWWRTLLVAALPWLLRLLPVRVLKAVVEGLGRMLLRAKATVGWPPLPPDWRQDPPPQPPIIPPLLLLRRSSSNLGSLPGGGVTAVHVEAAAGGGRGLRMGLLDGEGAHGGIARRGSGVGETTGGSAGGGIGIILSEGAVAATTAAADPAVGVRCTTANEAAMGVRTRGNWLGSLFPAAAAPPSMTAPSPAPLPLPPLPPFPPLATEPLATPISRHSGLIRTSTPYGSPGIDASGGTLLYGIGCESSRSPKWHHTAPSVTTTMVPPPPPPSPPLGVPFPVPTAAPRPRMAASPPPHRSTSEGDICGLEDAQRLSFSPLFPQTTPTAAWAYASTSPPMGHSHLMAHVVAGSAPSLGQGQGQGLGGGSEGVLGGWGSRGGHRGVMREADTEGDLLAVAAAASGGSGGAGGVSGRGRGKVCAIPTCGRKLDLRHYRDYMRRHYCGRCQRTVCGQHTAYSPHGSTGSCDHVSRCVCISCFTHFNPAYQQFLLKHNKLQPAAGVAAQQRDEAPRATGMALLQGQPETWSGRSGSASTSRRGSPSGVSGSGKAATDDRSAAKLLWERAATKLQAVTRFRKRGSEGHSREAQTLEGILE